MDGEGHGAIASYQIGKRVCFLTAQQLLYGQIYGYPGNVSALKEIHMAYEPTKDPLNQNRESSIS
jgi:hypothetical protein